jgi:hypothetical protein
MRGQEMMSLSLTEGRQGRESILVATGYQGGGGINRQKNIEKNKDDQTDPQQDMLFISNCISRPRQKRRHIEALPRVICLLSDSSLPWFL